MFINAPPTFANQLPAGKSIYNNHQKHQRFNAWANSSGINESDGHFYIDIFRADNRSGSDISLKERCAITMHRVGRKKINEKKKL
ncbi:hypothetical protein [Kluyvera sichuanensis]|uniref:hypothetical protein n=1 Tax=Kluyvera sichuanensis TaxID=2725494 RepID=UPI00397C1498